MWQNLLRHCAVLTKVSEEFAPHYLAEIRHDMRQTTVRRVLSVPAELSSTPCVRAGGADLAGGIGSYYYK